MANALTVFYDKGYKTCNTWLQQCRVFPQCMFVADAACHRYCTTEVSRCYSFSCGLCCKDMDAVIGDKPEMTPLSTCESSDSATQPTASCSSGHATDMQSPPSSKPVRKRKADQQTAVLHEMMVASQRRHEERMERQDRFLDLFQKMIEKN